MASYAECIRFACRRRACDMLALMLPNPRPVLDADYSIYISVPQLSLEMVMPRFGASNLSHLDWTTVVLWPEFRKHESNIVGNTPSVQKVTSTPYFVMQAPKLLGEKAVEASGFAYDWLSATSAAGQMSRACKQGMDCVDYYIYMERERERERNPKLL